MVLRVNIQIQNVSNIDFALSMIYGLSIRHNDIIYVTLKAEFYRMSTSH